MFKLKVGQGFSLVELMIVIALLGIIAAVAIPGYRDYVTKAEMSKGVFFISECRKQIENFYREYDKFPYKVCSVSQGKIETLDNGSVYTLEYGVNKDVNPQVAYLVGTFGVDKIEDANGNLEKTEFYTSIWFDRESDSFLSNCGQYDPGKLPSSYLHLMPSTCNDENISGEE